MSERSGVDLCPIKKVALKTTINVKGTWTNTKKVNDKIGIIAGSSEHNENEVINVH